MQSVALFLRTISTTMQASKAVIRKLFPILFWIAVWGFAAWRVGNTLLFPDPLAVLRALWQLLQTEGFYRATWLSLWNVLSGILFAMLLGIFLAVFTHRIPFLHELTLPIMTVIKATPVASFIVLLLIWIGSSKVPTLITFLIVLPVVWTNLDEGLRQQDKQLAEVAWIYRFSRLQKLRLLTVPTAMPYFLSACRTSLGLAWKAGIAAEIIAMPPDTIGTMIGQARQYLNTEEMFAWTLTVIVLSLVLEFCTVALLNRLERKKRDSVRKEQSSC